MKASFMAKFAMKDAFIASMTTRIATHDLLPQLED
jgi:hypothetical protein